MGTTLLLASTVPHAQTSPSGALARYARGDFAVIQTLRVEGLQALRREVKASSISPKIKAAFLLEATETFQHHLQLGATAVEVMRSPPSSTAPMPLAAAMADAFRDACDAVGKLPASDPFVELWFSAGFAARSGGSVGQSQATWQWRLLSSTSIGPCGDGHVDPGQKALSHAVPMERLAWRSLYQDRRTYVTGEQAEFTSQYEKRRLATLLAEEAKTVEQAIAELKKADAFESARAESLMRRGALLSASEHAMDALPLFDESQTLAHDEWIAYLDHLLKGRALETLGRTADAEASYRAALALRPKARSVNLALAALSFSHGRRADTNLLAVFDQTSDAGDPWVQLPLGPYRFWPARRDEMRRLLR
jgi:hypothetical protein